MKANDQYMVRPNSGKIGYGNISKTFEDEYNSAGCLTQTRGEDLYMRGVISQEKKRLQSQLKHKEEETLMKSRMNFTPHVNKSVGKAKSVYKQQNNIDFLGKVISDRELKKNQVKEKALQVEHEICTFQPKINKISNEIATKSFENYSQFGEQAASRFEHLYENSKVKHERQKFIKDSVMQNECPFKPQLYKPPKSVTKKVSTQTQLERAENHLKKAQMKKEMIEDIERIQLKTSFHPSIGRAPTDPTRPINVSIHNHLYNYRGVYDSKKNDLRQAQADMIKANQTVKVGMISDEIIENGMYEKQSKLFIMIDRDEDGVITGDDIDNWAGDFGDIPEAIIICSSQQLRELRDENSHVDIDNFITYFRNYLLTEPAKNTIIRNFLNENKREKYEAPQLTFQVISF